MTSVYAYDYPDGSRYDGEWNGSGQRHGRGKMSFPDGAKYNGQFDNGLSHGLGCLHMADGSSYLGEFSQGKFSGHGVFVRKDGMQYEGQFRDGKVWGLGLLKFPDGTHGTPRNEGYFEGSKLVERKKDASTQAAVRNAILAAERARNQQC